MSDACCADDDCTLARTPVHEEGAGITASDGAEETPVWWKNPALLPSAVSGVLLAAGYILQWSGADTASVVVLALSLVTGGSTFVPGTLRRLVRGGIGVGLLMTIAAAGAVLLGHVGEAAALAFLFSLSETLEDRAMDRAQDGLRSLLSLIPETARVQDRLGDRTIPASEVRVGNVLVVASGERVATDGVVVEGRSSLDTSAVTGESIPVQVGPADAVVAGSINGSATLRIRATADGRDNTLTQIVALVEQAQKEKGRRARMADRVARPLVPAVLVVSALVAAIGILVGDPWTWIDRALVVLVAASPCALAIAVPVTVISAIGSASRFGVVVKSGAAFEQFGTIRLVALDKTGTLTRNSPQVVEVRTVDGVSADRILALAAALERTSTHPLAAAVVAAVGGGAGGDGLAEDGGNGTSASVPVRVPVAAATDVAEIAGRGMTGVVDGRRIRLGNACWVDPAGLRRDVDMLEGLGMTVVVVEVDGRADGVIGVRDELRPEAAEMVRMLREQGVESVMLTGDNERTARAVAARAGIADVRAGQTPLGKAAVVERLSSVAPTAMVGDGINDAPALATATVGVAMGLTGSAAAIESADIAFTGRDLRLIPVALSHARRGRRIMTVNIGLALAIIVILFPLALTGTLGLAGVVLVHEVAEVVVILNGIRAARRPAELAELGEPQELRRSDPATRGPGAAGAVLVNE